MRLLVVEDEVDLAEVIEAMLQLQNYSVEVVHDGEDALYYVEQTHYDAMILDVMLPKKNGFEVAQLLRQRGIDIPILMLTAKSQLEDKVQGLELGADDYLTKPFEGAELIARVKSLLRRPSTYVPNNLSYGNVTLDRGDYRLIVGDKEIALNNKEFQLMEYFMMNTNQVLSTDIMMEKVWGLASEAEVNVVWVNISSLRKKLQQLEANIVIQSKRGLGYQLTTNEGKSHD